jgi:hypothetical protein
MACLVVVSGQMPVYNHGYNFICNNASTARAQAPPPAPPKFNATSYCKPQHLWSPARKPPAGFSLLRCWLTLSASNALYDLPALSPAHQASLPTTTSRSAPTPAAPATSTSALLWFTAKPRRRARRWAATWSATTRKAPSAPTSLPAGLLLPASEQHHFNLCQPLACRIAVRPSSSRSRNNSRRRVRV